MTCQKVGQTGGIYIFYITQSFNVIILLFYYYFLYCFLKNGLSGENIYFAHWLRFGIENKQHLCVPLGGSGD